MATLSGKLARIILPIDHFDKHLDLQENVMNPKLATQNFRYAGEALCNIWSRDLIFEKHVDIWYIDTFINLFKNLEFKGTEKEKAEELKRQEKQNQKNAKKKDEALTFSKCFVP